jgi:hypothetical protein
MRSFKLFVLIAMIAVLVLAFAAVASAQPGDSQGTVYGQATMQPQISIQVSGAGSDSGSPLVYWGRPNQGYIPNGNALVTVTNTGDQNVPILLGHGSDPTDGNDTWAFTDTGGPSNCIWVLYGDAGGVNVPGSGVDPREFISGLAPGDSHEFSSTFYFPSSYNGNTHTMTALLIASGIN